MLLNVANPLPRVCQAASERGVETVGFCLASRTGYAMLGTIMGIEPKDGSYHVAGRELWQVTMAGLNHFSWVVELRDRRSGADLLDEMRRHRVRGGRSANRKRRSEGPL